jgi:hypothetical protein
MQHNFLKKRQKRAAAFDDFSPASPALKAKNNRFGKAAKPVSTRLERCERSEHDDRRADLNPRIEIDNVVVQEADAA